MRKSLILAAILTLAIGIVAPATARSTGAEQQYVVVYRDGASLTAARAAIRLAGATVVRENAAVGVTTVATRNLNFVREALAHGAFAGVARRTLLGSTPTLVPKVDELAEASKAAVAVPRAAAAVNSEPLAGLQWGMAMIHATAAGSYAVEPGKPGVKVGIIDSGIDASHPDIAPNFDATLSHTFATDIPAIDGPCEVASCVDPPNVDDNGHGTHVAGIVGAALNGLGVAGVAPNVTLVNLRAGQDSGFVFLQPVVDALVYAGNNGIDVVNMSFYIDPWLFNCADNPADSPEAQAEQRAIVTAVQRALKYAHNHNVTLVNSLGNSHIDLDNPTSDATSPDYPPGSEYPRTINNSCLSLPAEGDHIIGVSALGPSTQKADYSNWRGEEQIVSAPGGWFRDFFGTPQYRVNENLILSTYPEALGRASGRIAPDGTPVDPAVVRDCQGGVCAYYQYLQGTSMASPHAAGVAALIVSDRGKADSKFGGLKMAPNSVRSILFKTATDHACPNPPTIDYLDEGRDASWTATCIGNAKKNNIWGQGIVDALRAVQ
jgi:subtilisin family serine protease